MPTPNPDVAIVRHRLIQAHFLEIVSAYRNGRKGERAVVVVIANRDDSLTQRVLGHLFALNPAAPYPTSPLAIVKELKSPEGRCFPALGMAAELALAVSKVFPQSRTVEKLRAAPARALNVVCMAAGGVTAACPIEHPAGWSPE
jgi:hypothetical protein